MNSSFTTLTDALMSFDTLTNNHNKPKVSKTDYEKFCKEFVFEKLKDNSFGKSFCEKFNFNDTFIKNLNDETAKYHIEKLGYINEK